MQVQMDTLSERYAGYLTRLNAAAGQFEQAHQSARIAIQSGTYEQLENLRSLMRRAESEMETAINGMTATEAGLVGLLETAEVFC